MNGIFTLGRAILIPPTGKAIFCLFLLLFLSSEAVARRRDRSQDRLDPEDDDIDTDVDVDLGTGRVVPAFTFHRSTGQRVRRRHEASFSCSISKLWECHVHVFDQAPQWVHDASAAVVTSQKQRIRPPDDLRLHTAYQIPVDTDNGELFTVTRLKFRINKELIKNKNDRNVTFWLQVTQTRPPSERPVRFIQIVGYRVEAWTKRALSLPFTEIVVNMDSLFELGRQYQLMLCFQSSDGRRLLSSYQTLETPSVDQLSPADTEPTCNDAYIDRSRKVAGRWVSGIQTELFPLHKYVNVTFFAAPKSLCFEAYDVSLSDDNYIILESFNVTTAQLFRNGSNWMGSVLFRNLDLKKNYTANIRALEYRSNAKSCLCRLASACNCVVAASKPFSLGRPRVPEFVPEGLPLPMPAPASDSVFVSLMMLFVVLIVGCVLLGIAITLIYRLCKSCRASNQVNVFLTTKNTSGDSLTPLIKETNDHVFFVLNANESMERVVGEFVSLLKENGYHVFHAASDMAQVQENTNFYVHKAVSEADKIILFHCERSVQLMSGCVDSSSHYLLEDVYAIALSMLPYSSNKLVHVKFEHISAKPLLAKRLFTLPRDSGYFFRFLSLSPSPTRQLEFERTYAESLQLIKTSRSLPPAALPPASSRPGVPKMESIDSATHESLSTSSALSSTDDTVSEDQDTVVVEAEGQPSHVKVMAVGEQKSIETATPFGENATYSMHSVDSGVHTS